MQKTKIMIELTQISVLYSVIIQACVDLHVAFSVGFHLSLQDFVQINGNTSLANQMKRAIKFARTHVVDCESCQYRGFLCEICSSTQVIFPFDLDTTTRVRKCLLYFPSQSCKCGIESFGFCLSVEIHPDFAIVCGISIRTTSKN